MPRVSPLAEQVEGLLTGDVKVPLYLNDVIVPQSEIETNPVQVCRLAGDGCSNISKERVAEWLI